MTDLKLVMDYDSLPLTPFCYFVAPEPLEFQGPKLFHHFMDLPLEIHRAIFQYCDTPTLFHLMHTSSYIRYECFDLFWEPDRNTWYRHEYAGELFDYDFFPIYHCPTFASRITQVEIGFPFRQLDRMARRGQAFWDKLQQLFPSMQNVVLSGNGPERLPPAFPSPISDLVTLAPPNITAFVAFQYGGYEGALRYRLWRVEAGTCWSIIQDPWTPMRVLLPAKKVQLSLLNDFLLIKRVAVASARERRGRDWLVLETYGRYSDSSGIDCPDPGCNTKFPTLEKLKMHIWHDSHEGLRNSYGFSMMKYHRNTPIEVRAILDTKQRRLDEMYFILTVLQEELREQYHKHGEYGQRQFEEALTGQMKEHGYLAPEKSLDDLELWHDLSGMFEYETDDYPEYPDEKDLDREHPEEEDFDHEYAGEDYFD